MPLGWALFMALATFVAGWVISSYAWIRLIRKFSRTTSAGLGINSTVGVGERVSAVKKGDGKRTVVGSV